jgi:tRNA (guanine37-N1)-methyltransferase
MFEQVFSQSIIKRALNTNHVSISYVALRQFATDAYGSVDDRPYGGGHGMVLRVDIVDKAIEFAKTAMKATRAHTVLLDASGTPYKQKVAQSLAEREAMILVCGHYEGVDARVFSLVDECISIGDYVLTGGEIPAMVLIDSVVRLLPGVLSKEIAT